MSCLISILRLSYMTNDVNDVDDGFFSSFPPENIEWER